MFIYQYYVIIHPLLSQVYFAEFISFLRLMFPIEFKNINDGKVFVANSMRIIFPPMQKCRSLPLRFLPIYLLSKPLRLPQQPIVNFLLHI